MKTVIMAGGKGTRISSIAADIPKPMIKINGKPVLEHEIECLKNQGFTDIIITVGHLGQQIIDYFGNGSKKSPITNKTFGVNIEYFFERTPLGTAGALFKIKDKLTEDFLLLNADAIFDVDFKRFVEFHKKNNALVTLFTHPNSHPYDSGLIIANDGIVEQWLTKEEPRPEYYQNRVNAGLHVVSKEVLNINIESEKIDLDRQILRPLASTKRMYVYDSPEYVKDMGTPERYHQVQKDFKNGTVKNKNLRNKQKAIFLDRDGTLNKHIGFLKQPNELELLSDVTTAIKKINESGYLAVIVTNQPVIARGDITFKELKNIHNKLETLLGLEGAYIDAIYFCPHHPDKGFEGEIAELKIDCECRKPKPGLLLQAAKDYNIDLAKSWIVGDSKCDIEAGKKVKCHTALITNDKNETYNANITDTNLNKIIDKIIVENR